MDRASRMLVRSAAKLIIEAMNYGETTHDEHLRLRAAYRRLIIALDLEAKANKRKST